MVCMVLPNPICEQHKASKLCALFCIELFGRATGERHIYAACTARQHSAHLVGGG